MKTVQKFVADDGTEFSSASDCETHEALCVEVAEVMALLPNRPDDDGCKFSNGHGYLQHEPATFHRVRLALLRIANRLMPHKWFEHAMTEADVHPSWPARLIDEMSRPLYRAWHRFYCTDAQLREWGQPFYANNPDKGVQIALQPGKVTT